MKAQNKVIVITGGGNGIGRELVLNLLSKGARVAAVDINASALQETVGLAGGHERQTIHTCRQYHRQRRGGRATGTSNFQARCRGWRH